MKRFSTLLFVLATSANASVKFDLEQSFPHDLRLPAALEKLNANLLGQSQRCRDEPVVFLSEYDETSAQIMWDFAKATGIQNGVLDLRDFDPLHAERIWSAFAATLNLFGDSLHLAILFPDPRKNHDAYRFWRSALTGRHEFYHDGRSYSIRNVDYVLFIPLKPQNRAAEVPTKPTLGELEAMGLPPEITGLFEIRYKYQSDVAIFLNQKECASELKLEFKSGVPVAAVGSESKMSATTQP